MTQNKPTRSSNVFLAGGSDSFRFVGFAERQPPGVGFMRRVMPAEVYVLEYLSPAFVGWELLIEIDTAGAVVGFGVQAPIDVQMPLSWDPEPPRARPTGGMSTALLRQLPFARLERAALYFARRDRKMAATDAEALVPVVFEGRLLGYSPVVSGGGPGTEEAVKAAARLAGVSRPSLRRGEQKKESDRKLAEFAASYVRALDSGAPIATLMAKTNLSRDEVRGLKNRAVERGLLAVNPPRADRRPSGVPSGELTALALQILSRQSAD